MEYSAAFIAKDKSRRLLTRGLSHDYKRVLATLARRVDDIRRIPALEKNDWFSTQCDLVKSIIRKISRTLDDIGDAIDDDPNRPATAIVSEYRAAILKDMRDLSNYSLHIQSRLNSIQRPGSNTSGGIDLNSQCQRAEKQIKSLINLPFNEQDINYRTINIRNEVNRIIEDLYDLFQKNGIDQRTQIVNNLHSTISTDQLLFSICMSNVLTNAVVHSGKQAELLITITENTSSQNDDRGQRSFVKISTTDNGVGIPLEDSKIIFHLFKQGSRTPSSEGNGVGLPFARAAAHMLGGDLDLARDSSSGAQFILSLPREPQS
jgi:signal transduction histidine kinase